MPMDAQAVSLHDLSKPCWNQGRHLRHQTTQASTATAVGAWGIHSLLEVAQPSWDCPWAGFTTVGCRACVTFSHDMMSKEQLGAFNAGVEGAAAQPDELFDPRSSLLDLVFAGQPVFPVGRFASGSWLKVRHLHHRSLVQSFSCVPPFATLVVSSHWCGS